MLSSRGKKVRFAVNYDVGVEIGEGWMSHPTQ